MNLQERILGGLWGSVVGDALGVPVEFVNRGERKWDPVTGMRAFGTHHQPAGTWSDDGSLLLCTVDSLIHSEFDTHDMGLRFLDWLKQGLWTARGERFDVGSTTRAALDRFAIGTPAEEAGGRDTQSNGNGSLMRILPVAMRFTERSAGEFAEMLGRASAITHAQARSKLACAFYGLVVRELLRGENPEAALRTARKEFQGVYKGAVEFPHFRRVMDDCFASLAEDEIESTGYVIHTLEASLWCLLTSKNFEECVLRAVNLGGDTDTTGCVAGGLAGTLYGIQSIPGDWLKVMARREVVTKLLQRFTDKIDSGAG